MKRKKKSLLYYRIKIKEEPTEIHSISSKIKIEPEDFRDTDVNIISSSSASSSSTAAITAFSPPPLPPSSIPSLLSTIPSTMVPPLIQTLPTTTTGDENLETNLSNIQKSINSGTNGQQDDNTNTKYCRNCDIKFNYMNTYIAHKQFYCKSNNNKQQQQQQRGEIKTPPSPVQTSPIHSLDNSNKNKENVEKVL